VDQRKNTWQRFAIHVVLESLMVSGIIYYLSGYIFINSTFLEESNFNIDFGLFSVFGNFSIFIFFQIKLIILSIQNNSLKYVFPTILIQSLIFFIIIIYRDDMEFQ
jgi:hypothetical protein